MTVTCPQCRGEIQPTWDWCQLCGFDPDGLRPQDPSRPGPAPGPPPTYAAPTYPPQGLPPGAAPPGYQPPGYGPPGYGPSGYGPPGYGPPPTPPNSSGGTALKIIGGVAVAFVLLIVVCIAAVTLLGRNASSKVASGTATTRTTATPTTTAPPVWSAWSAPDGTFGLEFPGTPKVEPYAQMAEQWASGQYAGVQLDRKVDRGYGVAWWDLKSGYAFTDPAGMLNALVDGLDASPELLVTTRQLGEFAGHQSMDFTATLTNGTALRGTAFFVGTRAYQLMVTAPAGDPTEYERFVASFHLV